MLGVQAPGNFHPLGYRRLREMLEQEANMPGRWKTYYFDRLDTALSVGPVGESALRKLNPTSFVVADLLDTLSWSLMTGCGVLCLHGALTRLSEPQVTLSFTVAAVGIALLAPIVKDGAVSFIADVAELIERRRVSPAQPEPDNGPIPTVMVKTATNPYGGTWKFYTPPVRKSGELVPPRSIKMVARQAMGENFVNFSERHFAGDLNVISGPDFRLLQADLVKRGWASKGSNNRVKIEPAGRAMLIKLATT